MDWIYWIVVLVLGAGLSFLQPLVDYFRSKEKKQDDISDRVGRLTKSLREATDLIANIEGEIKARSALALQLQDDIEQYNRIVELKKPEVEAVAQLLRGELKKENRESFWKGFAVNFVFFILGAAASWLINIVTIPK